MLTPAVANNGGNDLCYSNGAFSAILGSISTAGS